MEKMTPKEIAYECAISALYTRYNNLPNGTQEQKQIRNAIARLHNKLLNGCSLEGLELPVILNLGGIQQ